MIISWLKPYLQATPPSTRKSRHHPGFKLSTMTERERVCARVSACAAFTCIDLARKRGRIANWLRPAEPQLWSGPVCPTQICRRMLRSRCSVHLCQHAFKLPNWPFAPLDADEPRFCKMAGEKVKCFSRSSVSESEFTFPIPPKNFFVLFT